jgi:CBS-domain-containing membrane protein
VAQFTLCQHIKPTLPQLEENIMGYAVLNFAPLKTDNQFYLVEPGERLLNEDSPALKVMTDFKYVMPVTIDVNASIEYANNKMKLAGVRLLLVTDDDDGNSIQGIISATTILGERPIKMAQELRVSFADLTVKMLMTAQPDIKAINMISLKDARIGHIISTMKEIGRKHLLVTDIDEKGRSVVRGLFSITQINKQLGRTGETQVRPADSLAQLVR